MLRALLAVTSGLAFGLASGAEARADTVVLEDGATYDGRVTLTPEGVQIELDFGTVTFDQSLVRRIIRSRSPLDAFDDRLAAARGRPEALIGVALWAEQHGLARRSRDVYRMVIRLEPNHEVARRALGYVQVDGRWLSPREARRAAGLVEYGGVWLSPEQVAAREAAQRELRAQRAAADRPPPAEPNAKQKPEEPPGASGANVGVVFGWGWWSGYPRPLGWSGAPQPSAQPVRTPPRPARPSTRPSPRPPTRPQRAAAPPLLYP